GGRLDGGCDRSSPLSESAAIRRQINRSSVSRRGSGERKRPVATFRKMERSGDNPRAQFQADGTKALASRTICPPRHSATATKRGRPNPPVPLTLAQKRTTCPRLGRLAINCALTLRADSASG